VPSLESVRLKIERAREHYRSFSVEAHELLHGYSGKLSVEVRPFENFVSPSFEPDAALSIRLPMILGDCFQNLRSALDYIVWELVLAAGKTPTDKNSFPVCDTREIFEKTTKRGSLDGLSEAMVREIEFLQPYNDGESLNGHPYWLLNKLCNINKHRRILLVKLKTGFAGQPPGSDKYKLVPAGQPPPPLYIDLDLVAYLAFEEVAVVEQGEVGSLASQMIDSVERVLPNFASFF